MAPDSLLIGSPDLRKDHRSYRLRLDRLPVGYYEQIFFLPGLLLACLLRPSRVEERHIARIQA